MEGHGLLRQRDEVLEVDEKVRGRITFAQLFGAWPSLQLQDKLMMMTCEGMSDGLTSTLATTLQPSALINAARPTGGQGRTLRSV